MSTAIPEGTNRRRIPKQSVEQRQRLLRRQKEEQAKIAAAEKIRKRNNNKLMLIGSATLGAVTGLFSVVYDSYNHKFVEKTMPKDVDNSPENTPEETPPIEKLKPLMQPAAAAAAPDPPPEPELEEPEPEPEPAPEPVKPEENHPGGAKEVAMDEDLRAMADGYTVRYFVIMKDVIGDNTPEKQPVLVAVDVDADPTIYKAPPMTILKDKDMETAQKELLVDVFIRDTLQTILNAGIDQNSGFLVITASNEIFKVTGDPKFSERMEYVGLKMLSEEAQGNLKEKYAQALENIKKRKFDPNSMIELARNGL